MNSDERILELPQPIIDRLREVIARIRRLQWVKGSLLTLAALVAGLLAVAGLDAAFSLESVPLRVALSLVALGFTLAVAWTQWLRPLTRRISLTAVARWVETRHPELQERISTAVELLGDRHGVAGRESRELLEEVVKDAVADVGRMDPSQDLGPRRTRPAKWIAGSALGLLAILAALWPHQIPRLLARALVPTAQVGNAWADRLRVIVPESIVAIGDPLTIQVALTGKKERVELQMTPEGGSLIVESLPPDNTVPTLEGESGYSLRIPAVKQSFTARVIAGKAVSAPFKITAVPRPEAGPWQVTYQYPAYTGLKDSVQENAPGEIAALVGTKVTLHSPLNRAVEKAVVKIAGTDAAPPVLTSPPAPPAITWNTVLTPDLDATWTLNLEGAQGIFNHPVELPIRSFKDLPPVITLDTPAEDRLELRPVEKLPLTYSVKEDIGLSTVAIRIHPQDKPEYFLPGENLTELVEEGPGEFRGTALLDLSKILVPDNGEIRVSLMAADKVPPEMQGPQRAFSREIVIRFNKWTRPLVEQNFQAQHDELRKKMEDVKRELQSAKGRLNDKPDRLREDEKLSENTLKDLEAGSRHMETAQALMQELTARMKETAYARQTPELENISNDMVQPAQDRTKEIPLTDQKQTRSDLAKSSKYLLENAIQKLEAEQRQMDQDREAVQQVAKLSDIAEQQQRLAREAASASQPPSQSTQNPQAPAADPSGQQPPSDADPNAAANNKNNQAPGEANADPNKQMAANPSQPTAAAPPAPTDEEQRKWLEEQRRVAERAKQLMQENQNLNPQAFADALKQAAARAAELGAAAADLAKKEHTAAAEISQAATPESRARESSDQQALAAEVAALEEQARQFQEGSAKQIDQSTETQEAAHESRSNLGNAAQQANKSSQELAAAAAAPAQTPPADATNPDKSGTATPTAQTAATAPVPAPGSPEATATATPPPDGSPPATAAQASTDAAPKPGEPAASSSGVASAQSPAPGAEPTPQPSSNPNALPASGTSSPPGTPNQPSAPDASALAQTDGTDSTSGAPASPAGPPAMAGQQAARDSAKSLEEAAAALAALNKELNALAGMVADHNQSLGEGAQQAGTAVDQAAKSQNEQGKSPSMQQGAQAAQAAADQLAMAANTAMESMSIPSSAKSSKPSTAQSKGEGKSQRGQPDPAGGNGKDGKAGLQMDTANGAIPAELAKLGLSESDWVKLRSSLQGVDGASSTEIPAEYRDLVKAYFGAISKGGIAK
ncbi:MAG: hypothetical protein JWL81_1680 [Verrucomicrobiales bacterium]|nr:hypothetical protein [Verrucomicrobiales bacterium]